jgi:hypothetical protein
MTTQKLPMSTVVSSLNFEVVWIDEHLQEIVVFASSRFFSGTVKLYGGLEELARVAEWLHGFPNSPADRREIDIGQDDLPGYGSAKLSVFCTDALGHVAMEVRLRSCPVLEAARSESACVVINTAVGEVDRFASALRMIDKQVGEAATLRGAA